MAAVTLTRSATFLDPAFPSTEDLSTDQHHLIDDLNRRMDEGAVALEDAPCLCGGTDFDVVAEYDRYRIHQRTVLCRSCGLMQLNPRLTEAGYTEFYGSDHYRAIYNPEFLHLTEERFFSRLPEARHAWVSKAIDGRGVETILEVGCAAGTNLWGFHKAGHEVTGYDLGPKAVEFGRGLGLDLRVGSHMDVEGGPYDLIVLSHIVEHFTDPVAAVAHIAGFLADDGVMYIEVPDADEFCLGALQNAHVFYFSESTLKHYMGRAGLVPVAVNPCKPHIGVLFRRGAGEPVSLAAEHARMRGIVQSHDRRQRIKGGLDRFGLLPLARRLLGRG